MSHERAIHVLGFLHDFAAAYPSLCEGDQAMYRDLCRAALVSIDDEQRCESMLLSRDVNAVLFRSCREDVGAYVLRRLREHGFTVRFQSGTIYLGPKEKITSAVKDCVKHWKEGIREALLTEMLNEPAKENLKRA